ncbi:MAG: aldolase catalytic domain-containing protein [Bacillota bacterium]
MSSKERVKVFDCTIRDGGLINNWQFSEEMVRETCKAVFAAGLDYMEIGYRASKKVFSPQEFGPWRFCDEDVIRRVTRGLPGQTKLAVMVDVGRVETEDILPKAESVLSAIRVATYLHQIDEAVELANHISGKGYETFINIMAISHGKPGEIDAALEKIEAQTSVTAVNIVDSFGALYCSDVKSLIFRYRMNLKSKKVGIHAHNNQQLAFANTIEAINNDTDFLDATIYGIGRAAGNCPLELIVAYLEQPRFKLIPILQVISSTFVPLREKIEWGYLIPYMITGIKNMHPRKAMALLGSERRNEFSDFYEEIINSMESA